jgi:hypothetical protein
MSGALFRKEVLELVLTLLDLFCGISSSCIA